jgi:hypothetical protein
MIDAAIVFSGARLARHAATLAEAHAETALRRSDPRRWRTPSLLWPLFSRNR